MNKFKSPLWLYNPEGLAVHTYNHHVWEMKTKLELIRKRVFEECKGMPECQDDNECPYDPQAQSWNCILTDILDVLDEGYHDEN